MILRDPVVSLAVWATIPAAGRLQLLISSYISIKSTPIENLSLIAHTDSPPSYIVIFDIL